MGIVEKLKTTLGRAPTKEEVASAKMKRDAVKRNGGTLSHAAAAAAVIQEDWTCTGCGTVCFAQKSACFKCGTGRDGTIREGSTKHRRRDGIYTVAKAAAACEDKALTCQVCAAEFIFTAGEQDYFQRKGFLNSERTRCPECTRAKKRKLEGSGKPTCRGRLICFAWQKGNCAFGESCKFAHGEADGVLGDATSTPTRSPPSQTAAAAETTLAKALKCFHCGAEGHRVAECPKVKAQKEKEQAAHQQQQQRHKKKKTRNRNGTLPTANKVLAAA